MPRRTVAAFLLACLIAVASGAPGVAAGGFVPGTDDLPLMPGLTADAEGALVFDKPEGRIVEATARGKVTRAAVRQFYATTLPALGWRAEGAAWRRDRERLAIDLRGRDGDVAVGFTLTPR